MAITASPVIDPNFVIGAGVVLLYRGVRMPVADPVVVERYGFNGFWWVRPVRGGRLRRVMHTSLSEAPAAVPVFDEGGHA